MSVLEEILIEEYERSARLLDRMVDEYKSLPKGSIRVRRLKGHEYYYLNYRDGKKVKSDYISAAKIDEVRAQVERRRTLAAAIKEQRRSQEQIVRALGKGAIEMGTRE